MKKTHPVVSNAGLLAGFALLCTGFVAVVNHLTADTIAEQQQHYLSQVLDQIVPYSVRDEGVSQRCILVNNPTQLGTHNSVSAYIISKDKQPMAIAIEAVAPDGYNGNIKLILAVDQDDTLLGVRTLSHQETPGLGDKIELRKSSWVTGFQGLKFDNDASWRVKKDGGQFDQFTGATITPRAYVKAVAKAITFVKLHRQELLSSHNPCEANYE